MCSSLLETLHTGLSPSRAKTYIYLDRHFFHQQFVVFHINMYCTYFVRCIPRYGVTKSRTQRKPLRMQAPCRFDPLACCSLITTVSDSHSVMSDSCGPMNCNLPGSSVHGILQARILEWVAIPFSRGSF